MPDAPRVRPAPPDEIADALSFALRYQGRKRVHHADDMMARITADRLVQHPRGFGLRADEGSARGGANHSPHAARGRVSD